MALFLFDHMLRLVNTRLFRKKLAIYSQTPGQGVYFTFSTAPTQTWLTSLVRLAGLLRVNLIFLHHFFRLAKTHLFRKKLAIYSQTLGQGVYFTLPTEPTQT